MSETEILLDENIVDAICAAVSDFTVGFLLLSTHNGSEDGIPAGSGCLVSIGSVFGILTAAHVLENLLNVGHVGIVRFQYREGLQRQTIDMALATKIIIGGKKQGADGPDIGFLRLPPTNIGSLKATNVFFNLRKRQEGILSPDRLHSPHLDAVVGVIAERVDDLPPKMPATRLKEIGALFAAGKVVKESTISGFDLFDFEVSYATDTEIPGSYQGMSGGALWRTNVIESAEGQYIVQSKTVFGVAFHESARNEKDRIITCHGPVSVYDKLIGEIQKRWPEANAE